MPPLSTIHTLLFQDARDCSNIASESVDLVVTSPPYPMIGMWDELFGSLSPETGLLLSKDDGRAAFEVMHSELDKVWAHMFRIVRPGGFLCVNIGDATRTIGGVFRLYTNHTRIASRCVGLGFDALPMIHWWKPTNAPNKFMGSGMLPAGAYATLEHEYILLFRKGGKREFVREDEKLIRYQSAYFWEERNEWFSDTWELKGKRQDLGDDTPSRERSAAYPFELPWRLINMYSVQGDTVLDPFLGTGTTAFAAVAACRNSMGIEIDEALGRGVAKAIQGCGHEANEIIAERVRRHDDFVHERSLAGKQLKYVNEALDCPVMTAQETKIIFPLVDRINSMEPTRFMASYSTNQSKTSACVSPS